MLIIILISIISCLSASDTISVSINPDIVIKDKNVYASGACFGPVFDAKDHWNNESLRMGYGAWRIPDSTGGYPDYGSYNFGVPDSDFIEMLEDAGLKVLRCNSQYDWKYTVGPWCDTNRIIIIDGDTLHLPPRIREFGLVEYLNICKNIGAKACITYSFFEDTGLYADTTLDTIITDMKAFIEFLWGTEGHWAAIRDSERMAIDSTSGPFDCVKWIQFGNDVDNKWDKWNPPKPVNVVPAKWDTLQSSIKTIYIYRRLYNIMDSLFDAIDYIPDYVELGTQNIYFVGNKIYPHHDPTNGITGDMHYLYSASQIGSEELDTTWFDNDSLPGAEGPMNPDFINIFYNFFPPTMWKEKTYLNVLYTLDGRRKITGSLMINGSTPDSFMYCLNDTSSNYWADTSWQSQIAQIFTLGPWMWDYLAHRTDSAFKAVNPAFSTPVNICEWGIAEQYADVLPLSTSIMAGLYNFDFLNWINTSEYAQEGIFSNTEFSSQLGAFNVNTHSIITGFNQYVDSMFNAPSCDSNAWTNQTCQDVKYFQGDSAYPQGSWYAYHFYNKHLGEDIIWHDEAALDSSVIITPDYTDIPMSKIRYKFHYGGYVDSTGDTSVWYYDTTTIYRDTYYKINGPDEYPEQNKDLRYWRKNVEIPWLSDSLVELYPCSLELVSVDTIYEESPYNWQFSSDTVDCISMFPSKNDSGKVKIILRNADIANSHTINIKLPGYLPIVYDSAFLWTFTYDSIQFQRWKNLEEYHEYLIVGNVIPNDSVYAQVDPISAFANNTCWFDEPSIVCDSSIRRISALKIDSNSVAINSDCSLFVSIPKHSISAVEIYPNWLVSLREGWNLISLPFYTAGYGGSCSDSLRDYFDTSIVPDTNIIVGDTSYSAILGYDENATSSFFVYVDFSDSLNDPSYGFWVYSLKDTTLTYTCTEAASFDAEWSPGWHLAGSINTPRTWDDAIFTSGSASDIIPPLYAYSTKNNEYFQTEYLMPYFGQWIFTIDSVSLEYRTTYDTSAFYEVAEPNLLFNFRISASSSDSIDTMFLYFGIDTSATSGFDKNYDVAISPEYPAFDPDSDFANWFYISEPVPLHLTRAINGVKYCQSEWQLQLCATERWLYPDIDSLPDDSRLYLLTEQQKIYDLANLDSLYLTGQQVCQIFYVDDYDTTDDSLWAEVDTSTDDITIVRRANTATVVEGAYVCIDNGDTSECGNTGKDGVFEPSLNLDYTYDIYITKDGYRPLKVQHIDSIYGNEVWCDDVELLGDAFVMSSDTLLVLPGTNIRAKPNSDVSSKTGDSDDSKSEVIAYGGHLAIKGLGNSPIVFAPGPGGSGLNQWACIYIVDGGSADIEESSVERSTHGILVSGSSSYANVENTDIFGFTTGIMSYDGADIDIDSCDVKNTYYGIYATGSDADVVLKHTSIDSVDIGIHVQNEAYLWAGQSGDTTVSDSMAGNSITNCSDYYIRSTNQQTSIYCQYIWFGDSAGPNVDMIEPRTNDLLYYYPWVGASSMKYDCAHTGVRCVPIEYSTISNAIENSVAAGDTADTVYILKGTFEEHGISIDKPLLLVGNAMDSTVIDGNAIPPRVFTTNTLNSGDTIFARHFTVKNGRDTTNLYDRSAGGWVINTTSGEILLDSVKFDACTCRIGGGAIALYQGYLRINHCYFTNNVADPYLAGAIDARDVDNGLTIQNSRFTNNKGYYGGAIKLYGKDGNVIENCIFENNYASHWGGAIDARNSNTNSIFNCTYYSNVADVQGGAMSNTVGSSTTWLNNIFWDDSTAGNGDELYLESSTYYLLYCDIDTNKIYGKGYINSIIGRIDTIPYFVDADNNDLHLTDSSYCINTGRDTLDAPDEDFDGNTRPDSSEYDIGAYEYYYGAFSRAVGRWDKPPEMFPRAVELGDAHPNPFNSSITIEFEVYRKSEVEIAIHSLDGKMVRHLLRNTISTGLWQTNWDGFDDSSGEAPSGVYLVVLKIDGDRVESKKISLIR